MNNIFSWRVVVHTDGMTFLPSGDAGIARCRLDCVSGKSGVRHTQHPLRPWQPISRHNHASGKAPSSSDCN